MSTESNKLLQRKAWKGKCLVIVKSNHQKGRIKLTAKAVGLQPATIEVLVN